MYKSKKKIEAPDVLLWFSNLRTQTSAHETTMLSNIIQGYSSKYSKEISDKDYYLHWLENDIILELNDNIGMLDGIQPNLQKAFPKMSCAQINQKLNAYTTETTKKRSIENLWRFLPDQGKKNIASFKHLTQNN